MISESSSNHLKCISLLPFRSITPTNSLFVDLVTNGDGWHNYHHVFPWDYRSAEIGQHPIPSFSKFFIELCAFLGLAYNLKTVTDEMQIQRAKRTGDGSRKSTTWGWGDKETPEESIHATQILYP